MARLVMLASQADFARFRSSRSFSVQDLRIRVLSTLNQNAPRFGFIIPKKVLPKVTDRNVVKRRLKTILLKHSAQIKSHDVLFFPSAKILKMKFADLEKNVVQLFKRANLWKS